MMPHATLPVSDAELAAALDGLATSASTASFGAPALGSGGVATADSGALLVDDAASLSAQLAEDSRALQTPAAERVGIPTTVLVACCSCAALRCLKHFGL